MVGQNQSLCEKRGLDYPPRLSSPLFSPGPQGSGGGLVINKYMMPPEKAAANAEDLGWILRSNKPSPAPSRVRALIQRAAQIIHPQRKKSA